MGYKVLSDETFSNEMEKLRTAILASASNSGSLAIDSFDDLNLLVRLGEVQKFLEVGDQIEVEKEKTLIAGVGDSQGIKSASVDEDIFLAKMGTAESGIYEATFDGAVWHWVNGESISLGDYGITVDGTPQSGDHIVITETTECLAFDVLDFNKYTPKDTRLQNCIVLGLHNVYTYGTIPFSPSQLMYYTDVELPAGKYKFALNHGAYDNSTGMDGTFMFTLTKPIPADGGFRCTTAGTYTDKGYTLATLLTGKIITYGARPSRAEVEQVSFAEWDGSACTDLGTFTAKEKQYHTFDGKHNFTQRNGHGCNRWRDSVYRQWLNSDAPAVPSSDTTTVSNWWKPATVFDRVPGGAKLAGFLHGLDKKFIDALGEVEVITALPLCDIGDDGVKFDVTYDKIFLQSITNVFGNNENGVAEGVQLEYWKGKGNADRIKYLTGTARYWWLRSPHSSIANCVRCVYTSGVLNYNYAYYHSGVVPACCICGKQVVKDET